MTQAISDVLPSTADVSAEANARMAAALMELAEQARKGSLLGLTFITLSTDWTYRSGAEGLFAAGYAGKHD